MDYRFFVLLLSMMLYSWPFLQAESLGESRYAAHASADVILKSYSWEEICKNSKDAVVQVFSYISEPNILKPYESPHQSAGAGSGFCISGDGYLLTNYHVVSNAIAIYIQIPSLGKERFEVEYVGSNPQRDVALLRLKEESLVRVKDKLKVKELPFLPLGDSDSLVEAQMIMALGYPLGQENLKVSIGSVAGRESLGIGECIQTTTPINAGNSGGPFVDSLGRVVGLCVLKMVGAEVEGVGYLIPINNIKIMLQTLYKNKIVKNPLWGIGLMATLPSTLQFLGNPIDGGVYVTKVQKGLLADKHEIAKGDVLYTIDGHKIDRFGYLNAPWGKDKVSLGDYLSRIELGKDVKLGLYRQGEYREVLVTIEDLVEPFAVKRYYPWVEDTLEFEVLFGAVFVPLLLDHVELFKSASAIPEEVFDASFITRYGKFEERYEPRLIISSVLPTSLLHETRSFSNGDIVIKEVNGKTVKTLDEFRQAILSGADQEFVTIETEGGSFVAMRLQEALAQEPILADRYGYEISNLVEALA